MPKRLIVVAERLAAVLDRENEALRAMDLRRAATLLPEKNAAIADLTASGKTALAPPDPAAVAAVRRLDRLMSENRRLLERAIAAQQRVIGIVVRAAASTVVEPSYGASRGGIARGRQTRSTGPMALSTRA
jgi:hypothetical protein